MQYYFRVYSGSTFSQASQYQGPQALDSILHYPMYGALTNAFTIPGPQNMSAVVDMVSQSKKLFKDPTVCSLFILLLRYQALKNFGQF